LKTEGKRKCSENTTRNSSTSKGNRALLLLQIPLKTRLKSLSKKKKSKTSIQPQKFQLIKQCLVDFSAVKRKPSASQRARLEFERIQQQKLEKKAELERKKEEKEKKLQEYKQKKAEKFRRLSKKTRKGQPVMKDRLEMLLEKIQKQCS
jgi:hypothetical protein